MMLEYPDSWRLNPISVFSIIMCVLLALLAELAHCCYARGKPSTSFSRLGYKLPSSPLPRYGYSITRKSIRKFPVLKAIKVCPKSSVKTTEVQQDST